MIHIWRGRIQTHQKVKVLARFLGAGHGWLCADWRRRRSAMEGCRILQQVSAVDAATEPRRPEVADGQEATEGTQPLPRSTRARPQRQAVHITNAATTGSWLSEGFSHLRVVEGGVGELGRTGTQATESAAASQLESYRQNDNAIAQGVGGPVRTQSCPRASSRTQTVQEQVAAAG